VKTDPRGILLRVKPIDVLRMRYEVRPLATVEIRGNALYFLTPARLPGRSVAKVGVPAQVARPNRRESVRFPLCVVIYFVRGCYVCHCSYRWAMRRPALQFFVSVPFSGAKISKLFLKTQASYNQMIMAHRSKPPRPNVKAWQGSCSSTSHNPNTI
jgi:hypothetical protein